MTFSIVVCVQSIAIKSLFMPQTDAKSGKIGLSTQIKTALRDRRVEVIVDGGDVDCNFTSFHEQISFQFST